MVRPLSCDSECFSVCHFSRTRRGSWYGFPSGFPKSSRVSVGGVRVEWECESETQAQRLGRGGVGFPWFPTKPDLSGPVQHVNWLRSIRRRASPTFVETGWVEGPNDLPNVLSYIHFDKVFHIFGKRKIVDDSWRFRVYRYRDLITREGFVTED